MTTNGVKGKLKDFANHNTGSLPCSIGYRPMQLGLAERRKNSGKRYREIA